MALAGPVLLSSPQLCTAAALRYRPAGLPGFGDLPLLILAVEHGADAVRVLGPQLHSGKQSHAAATPVPARTGSAGRPGPSPPQPPVPRLLPAVPAAPGAGGGASAARGSPAGGCSWPAPAPRRAPAAVTSRPRVTSVPSNARGEIPVPHHRRFPWGAGGVQV